MICQNQQWPTEVTSVVKKLPLEFFSDWSLGVESSQWLYQHIETGSYQSIVECGTGLSTVLIALAVQQRRTRGERIRACSLEHDENWLAKVQSMLETLGLTDETSVVHSPIVRQVGEHGILNTYELSHLPTHDVDFLLIDGPPQAVGRGDVLPAILHHLKHDATIVLDDAARSTERRCVARWIDHRWASVDGYLALDHGLAILRARSV